MNTPTACPTQPPSAGMQEAEFKNVKSPISKRIKDTLLRLLSKDRVKQKQKGEDAGLIKLGSSSDSLTEHLPLYGFLTNPITKKSDLIVGARTEYFSGGNLVFYTVEDGKLFKSFPAAGIYQGPYEHNKPVFVEVCARIDDMYVCKAAHQLRYVELMEQNKEK